MWSPQQDKALKAISAWFNSSDRQMFRLFGYAGTGKTTLARQIMEDIGQEYVAAPGKPTDDDPNPPPRNVETIRFCAYTGKAAHVLRSKQCSPSSTIHSLIYNTHPELALTEDGVRAGWAVDYALAHNWVDENGLSDLLYNCWQKALKHGNPWTMQPPQMGDLEKYGKAKPSTLATHRLVTEWNEDSDASRAKLIIVDECSMVDEEMAQDLLRYGKKILVLGDPAQLPPVGGNGYFIDAEPDMMLTEVHRQAKDDPIIALATMAREGQFPKRGSYGLSQVINADQRDRAQMAELMLGADQILVGKNATRRMFNARMRQLKGFSGDVPMQGEKVICLKNNHMDNLFNGSMWTVAQPAIAEGDVLELSLKDEEGRLRPAPVRAYASLFAPEETPVAFGRSDEGNQFTYGYAITTHKSQGSQWDNVVLWNQAGTFREDRWKWLYTGITRAAKQLTLVYP